MSNCEQVRLVLMIKPFDSDFTGYNHLKIRRKTSKADFCCEMENMLQRGVYNWRSDHSQRGRGIRFSILLAICFGQQLCVRMTRTARAFTARTDRIFLGYGLMVWSLDIVNTDL